MSAQGNYFVPLFTIPSYPAEAFTLDVPTVKFTWIHLYPFELFPSIIRRGYIWLFIRVTGEWIPSVAFHMSALRWTIHPSLRFAHELWWLAVIYGSSLGPSGAFQVFRVATKSWVESSWPEPSRWSPLFSRPAFWCCSCVDQEIVWDKIYSSADMSLTGIKRWKASVLTYWTAPLWPGAAPLHHIDDCNCPCAASSSSSRKYSNGAYAGAPQNPDS